MMTFSRPLFLFELDEIRDALLVELVELVDAAPGGQDDARAHLRVRVGGDEHPLGIALVEDLELLGQLRAVGAGVLDHDLAVFQIVDLILVGDRLGVDARVGSGSVVIARGRRDAVVVGRLGRRVDVVPASDGDALARRNHRWSGQEPDDEPADGEDDDRADGDRSELPHLLLAAAGGGALLLPGDALGSARVGRWLRRRIGRRRLPGGRRARRGRSRGGGRLFAAGLGHDAHSLPET